MSLVDDAQEFVNRLQISGAESQVSELLTATASRILVERGRVLDAAEEDALNAMQPLELSEAVLRLAREPFYMLEDELGIQAPTLN